MSRFNCYECDGEGPPHEFWRQAARNALRGRKGQAVLRELREALLALSASRLLKGYFCHDGEVCALGALAKYRLERGQAIPATFGRAQYTRLEEIERAEDVEDEYTTMYLGEKMGLKKTLAWAVAWENDEGGWDSDTPEQRYQRMSRWVEGQIAPEEQK